MKNQKKKVLGTEILEMKITKNCVPETRIHGNVRKCMIKTKKRFFEFDFFLNSFDVLFLFLI